MRSARLHCDGDGTRHHRSRLQRRRDLPWGGIMASAGWIPKGEWFGRERTERNEDAAIDAALEAVCLLAAS